MSIKSLVQILILLLITLIIISVYYKYFNTNNKIVEEINSPKINNEEQLKELEKKITILEIKNEELISQIELNKENLKKNILKKNVESKKNINNNDNKVKLVSNNKIIESEGINKKIKKTSNTEKKINNLVKDVEYTSVDQRGNKFHLLANSGKSNSINTDILDLINVRGKIISDRRDTIYIVSDFAKYNSLNLNSQFYENVIINYQDKEITCTNFDISMETNKAIAYNNVFITDPKSTMKAGIVEFDLKTKNININPESSTEEIEVVTN